MAAVLFTQDLMFGSQFTNAANMVGVSAAMVGSTEKIMQAIKPGEKNFVAIDLAVRSLNLSQLIAEVRASGVPCTIAAYDAHVREESLAAARAASCDLVLTRGQFCSQLPQLLRTYGA
jgi:hypothetical protein